MSATLETLRADFEKQYPGGPLVAASLEIPSRPSRVSILFGRSGSGKTTILRCLAGLESISSGKIVYGDHTWEDKAARRWLPPQKRSVGYLFQDYALFPHLTARANVAYGLGRVGRFERDRRVEETSRMLGILDLLERRPGQLSGGQQQRVALARVIVRQPALLLLDEPFSSLDAPTREEVRSQLARVLRSLSIPAIVVTHDWVDALTLGDEMMVISDGRILQTGSPQEVLTKPKHRDVASAVGVETVAKGRLATRKGGIAILRVGSCRLVAVDPGGDDCDFYICVRGEDVTLETGPPRASSARNHLPGRVVHIVPTGVLTKVIVDVGFELVALVTRQAAEDLDLFPGGQIYAAFKASIVHLIPRGS
jgi:molybdate transport system ATP-binding protein